MFKKSFLTASLAVSFALAAQAQWIQTTYTLKGGWNAIYLHGDCTYATPDTLFPNSGATAAIEEVWRWNPNPNQVQFSSSPLAPTPGTPEWRVWRRGLPSQSNLSLINGQTAYLVKCSGTGSATHTVQLVQKAMPPSATWVRAGANLLGFPASANQPSFSTYFQSFPTAVASRSKIYKYTGGELGPANPIQVFSPTVEPLNRNTAYWFEAEVVGNFYAPIDISLSSATGIDFGRSGSVVTARLRNTTSVGMTLTLAPVASIAAPSGVGITPQDAVIGNVPLTKRSLESGTGNWSVAPITEAYSEFIGPNSTVELSFGVDRTAMTGPSESLYASLLRITDSANRFDISLPVSARVPSLAGLWVGEAQVATVSSQVQATATATAVVTDGVLTGITLTGGGLGYSSAPVPIIAPPEGVQATAIASVEGGAVSGLTLVNAGSGYAIAPVISLSPPPSGNIATAVASVKNGVLTGVTITDGGSGYAAPPVVTISSPLTATTPAQATALMAASGLVQSRRYASETEEQPLGIKQDLASVDTNDRPYGDNNIYIYRGHLVNVTSSPITVSFAENYDDQVIIKLDGAVVLNDVGWNVPSQSAALSITPGAHSLEIQAIDIAGVAGPVDGWTKGIGIALGLPPLTNANYLPVSAATMPAGLSLVYSATGAGSVTALTVTDPGAGYFSAPTVTLSASDTGGVNATGVAVVQGGKVIGLNVTNGGTGYTAPPTVTIGTPPPRTAAVASAIIRNGKVTGFTILDRGSGYLAAPAITIPTPTPPGSTTARKVPLRVLLHIDDAGNSRLLSQVFIGKLAGGEIGLCTKEASLSANDKRTASRYVAAHMPLDRVIGTGAGQAGLGQTLVRTVAIPYDDETNFFVHRYHPDHDNKDARGGPLSAGVESYGITRTMSFQFTTTRPEGQTPPGWGSTILGGNYTEVFKGLHQSDITVTGTFELRRASEIGSISID